jgi:hypothetical protein
LGFDFPKDFNFFSIMSLNLSTSPKTVVQEWPQKKEEEPDPNQETNAEKNVITSLAEFVDQLPAALRKRKQQNIKPGACNDPVCSLYRYES